MQAAGVLGLDAVDPDRGRQDALVLDEAGRALVGADADLLDRVDAGRRPEDLAALDRADLAEVGADAGVLDRRDEREDVLLGVEGREVVARARARTGAPPSFWIVAVSASACACSSAPKVWA